MSILSFYVARHICDYLQPNDIHNLAQTSFNNLNIVRRMIGMEAFADKKSMMDSITLKIWERNHSRCDECGKFKEIHLLIHRKCISCDVICSSCNKTFANMKDIIVDHVGDYYCIECYPNDSSCGSSVDDIERDSDFSLIDPECKFCGNYNCSGICLDDYDDYHYEYYDDDNGEIESIGIESIRISCSGMI